MSVAQVGGRGSSCVPSAALVTGDHCPKRAQALPLPGWQQHTGRALGQGRRCAPTCRGAGRAVDGDRRDETQGALAADEELLEVVPAPPTRAVCTTSAQAMRTAQLRASHCPAGRRQAAGGAGQPCTHPVLSLRSVVSRSSTVPSAAGRAGQGGRQAGVLQCFECCAWGAQAERVPPCHPARCSPRPPHPAPRSSLWR